MFTITIYKRDSKGNRGVAITTSSYATEESASAARQALIGLSKMKTPVERVYSKKKKDALPLVRNFIVGDVVSK